MDIKTVKKIKEKNTLDLCLQKLININFAQRY